MKKIVNLTGGYCKICESDKLQLHCVKNNFRIIKCNDCESGFLDLGGLPFDANSFYHGYYQKNNRVNSVGYGDYFASEKALKLTFKRRLNFLCGYVDGNLTKKKLLDIGCGPGFFLEMASRYFSAYGVEISRSAVDLAREETRLKIINSEFRSELFEPGKFDIVTLWDTLEHVSDPHKALMDVSIVMKKGGILAFTTGDFKSIAAMVLGKKWHLLNVPEHLFFFSKRSICILLSKAGFKIEHLGYPFAYYTLDYMIERAIKSLDVPLRSHLKQMFKKVILPFNLFDIFLVIGRKG